VSLTSDCTPKCWTPVTCAVCGLRKQPRGRSAPLEMANSLCEYDCPGYLAEPLPVPHLWPSEAPDAKGAKP